MAVFVWSLSFTSLPSFTFVSAAVSEIRESNRKKKKEKEKNNNSQFNTFPGHIFYPCFYQRYLLSTCTDSIC